ncbi:class I SAM-dependent methyltransferase [Microvirga calopogonii]|uniref:class I SAM-dependent methyltransferase n=1 Tax=Microvirga calopogonii TaxID=2078013 RepID=UPI000E0D6110|nr:class I SAM-dependent methyltransferase [Microvirga calopogonii]
MATQAIFQTQWQTYRKVIDRNYMFHREVYGLLHEILVTEAPQPFRFLDIACGDATGSAAALKETAVARYVGIDLSEQALALAAETLKPLPCPVTLVQADFAEALANWSEPVDVVWIGQSLHHLGTDAKGGVMHHVRRILNANGLFLIWEPTLSDGEDRDGWLDRFEHGSPPLWPDLDATEWDAMITHVRASDYPEPVAGWRALGLNAGFRTAETVFVAPTELARVYRYRP